MTMIEARPPLDLKRTLIAELEAAEAAFLNLAPDAAIHAGRVRLKRVRALARIAVLAAPWTARRIDALARDIMAAMSAARDLAALEALAARSAKGARGGARKALEAVAMDLAAARADLPPCDLSLAADQTRSLIGLARALPGLDEEDIAAGLARVLARSTKAWRRARGAKAELLRHAWRKREKDRLYALKLLNSHWPSAAARRRRCSAQLCEALGEERDALLLRAYLKSHAPQNISEANAKAARRAIARLRHQERRAADALGKRVHAPLKRPRSPIAAVVNATES
jgi:hypothetical protein